MGYNEYALHEALELLSFTDDITIFTNGKDLEISESNMLELAKFKINKDEIAELVGTEKLEAIKLKNGENVQLQGLFIAYGTASSVSFAQKLGVVITDGSVVTDTNQATNIGGLYAAGDCTGGFAQVSVAVGQGAIAAKSMISFAKAI